MTTIPALLATVPADRVPVIFNGPAPRLIGTLAHLPPTIEIARRIDPMLRALGLSARYISTATVRGGERVFIVAHGG